MDNLNHLFKRNRDWAKQVKKDNPNFFTELSEQQAPKYLWIGCSDSRVPANQIVNLPPGEIFVHRNIANVVVHTDLNCLSVIQYAIEMLKVEHIVVCGHYGCGGINAAMEKSSHGLIDNWLCHIKDVSRLHKDKFVGLSKHQQQDLLCELNVKEQVLNVCSATVVQSAWKQGKKLSVHGWVYSIKNGIIVDLETSISSMEQLSDSPHYQ
ncbi:MAG: carbonate dehydratase [Oceanospirillaceae bacterium]|nr:carbonate dehydratase [Oceanospirillaceae bacterium]